LKMLFLREIKVLEARQRLEALVIPKRQTLTRLQGLLAPLLHIAEIDLLQQLKTSIFRLFGYTRLNIQNHAVQHHGLQSQEFYADPI
jgi:hypothetical protein